MGYTIVRAPPTGDRVFQQLLIGGAGFLSRVRGLSDIPFEEDDIAESFRREPWDYNVACRLSEFCAEPTCTIWRK